MLTRFSRRAIVAMAILVLWTGIAFRPVRAASPTRIVSTSPSITETLFALGLGDRVVGVSNYCRFPAEVAKLPRIGTFLKPNAELIAGLRPDLVVVHATANGLDRRLTSLSIPFVVVERGTLASVFTSIRQIGTAAAAPDRAEALIASIQQRLATIRRLGATQPHRRVLFIVGRRPGALADLVAVGPGSYLNDVIEIAGGTNVLNIAGQPEYPRISMEAVLRLDPDVIIDTVDMGDTDAERLRRQPVNERLWAAYGTLSAVKAGRLHAASTDALVVPGPRVVDAAEWVAALLRDTPRP
jgi:iron complex transport system substrate-binding protein